MEGIPQQIYDANSRWYKRTFPDGTRKWMPTADYDEEQKIVQKYSQRHAKEEDMGYEERPDINVVGPYGKPPTFEAGQFGEFLTKGLADKRKEQDDDYEDMEDVDALFKRRRKVQG